MPERQHYSKKRKAEISRRNFLRFGGILALVFVAGGSYWLLKDDTSPIDPEKLANLDNEQLDILREQFIGRDIQKPQDAVLFPSETNEHIIVPGAENITISLNGMPSSFNIYYSPEGVRKLQEITGLKNTTQLHLYTCSDTTNGDVEWQAGNCKLHSPIPYVSELIDYVLPRFSQNQWETRNQEIVKEWNNRLQAITYHEVTHAANHFEISDCNLVSSVSAEQAEKEAMIAELTIATSQPAVFWIEFANNQNAATSSTVRACLR